MYLQFMESIKYFYIHCHLFKNVPNKSETKTRSKKSKYLKVKGFKNKLEKTLIAYMTNLLNEYNENAFVSNPNE